MKDIALTTPRYTTFDADLMTALAQPFPVWPRADEPRPFDRDACVDLATYVGEHFWGRHRAFEPHFPERDGVLTRAEAAFWFGVFSAQGLDGLTTGAREWIEERGAQFDEHTTEDDFVTAFELAISTYLNSLQTHLLAHVARTVIPWSRLYEATLTQVGMSRAGYMLQDVGYCPADEREAALAIAREHTAGIPKDQWANNGVLRARVHIPDDELVEAARTEASNDTLIGGHEDTFTLCLISPDHDLVDRLVRKKAYLFKRKHIHIYVARRGLDDLDAFVDVAMTTKGTPEALGAFVHIKAPEVIAKLHPHTLKGGERGEIAQRILDEAELEHAAHGLVVSCARAGKKRAWAVTQLRKLIERDGGREALEAALPHQRKKLADFVRAEVLDHDDIPRVALADAPEWARTCAQLAAHEDAPIWLVPDDLPPAILSDSGLALPTECVTGMVVLDTYPDRREEVDEAKATLTEESLVALTNALMTQWLQAKRLADVPCWRTLKYARPLSWVGAHPSPAGVASLEKYIRTSMLPHRYPDTDAMVYEAISVLGRIEEPEAIAAMLRIASVDGRRKSKQLARKALEAHKAARGIVHDDELEDLAVSTFGLDALGRRDFDYGKRTIRMFVSGGELLFEDLSKDKVVKNPPKGLKSDDVDKVAAARAVFDATVKPLRASLTGERIRFEEQMISGRRWRGRWWREHVWSHPLLGPMARGLVWQVWRGDELVATVRPTEDGGVIDADFEEYAVEDDDTLTLPHPLDLGEDAVSAWTEHMLEFERVQPFDQLSRDAIGREEALEELGAFADGAFTLDWQTLRAIGREAAGTFDEPTKYGYGTWRLDGRQGLLSMSVTSNGKGKYVPLSFAGLNQVGRRHDFSPFHDVILSELTRLLRRARSG